MVIYTRVVSLESKSHFDLLPRDTKLARALFESESLAIIPLTIFLQSSVFFLSFGPHGEYEIDFENVAENEEPHTSNNFWQEWTKIVSVI